MKKLFLLFAASALVVSAVAQKPAVNPTPKKVNQTVRKVTATEPISSMNLPKPLVSNSKAVVPIYVGSSGNCYSALQPRTDQVAYQETFNLISFAHRGGPTNGTGSQIYNNISTDNGATWDTLNRVYNNPTGFNGRYPNGAFFNPTGNTDVNNLFTINAGPITNGTDWVGTYVSWKKGSATPKQYIIPSTNPNRIVDQSLQMCQDGRFYISGDEHEDDGTYLTKHHFNVIAGTLDYANDTVSNISTTIIEPPFLTILPADTNGYGRYKSDMAFNKAGTVGYCVFTGVRGDVANPTSNVSYRPIVYKTIDAGATWNIQPDFDFSSLDIFQTMLSGTAADTTKIVAYYDDVDEVIVDGNDNLHILSYVYGASSTSLDSIGYIWTYQTLEGIMYDTYMTSTGWDATIIDAQNTKDVDAATPNIECVNRLQAALSNDGKTIFYSWADSDPAQGATENVLPDLYIVGRNVDSIDVATKMNVTAGTSFEYGATLHTMAPQMKEISSGTYMPFFVLGQMGTNQDSDPAKYYFLKDVNYAMVVSVNDIDKNIANISNLYPNPTNGLTNVDLTLVKNADVSIQVVNMMGQVVSSQDCGYKTTGMHKLTINANDLTSGIYFVTVKAGNSTSTSKMIVR